MAAPAGSPRKPWMACLLRSPTDRSSASWSERRGEDDHDPDPGDDPSADTGLCDRGRTRRPCGTARGRSDDRVHAGIPGLLPDHGGAATPRLLGPILSSLAIGPASAAAGTPLPPRALVGAPRGGGGG